MERRKSTKKSMKRLSSVKMRSKTLGQSVLDAPKLPAPNFEIEDVLLSQLQVSDVLSNCIARENTSSWNLNKDNNYSPIHKSKQSSLLHKCYSDNTLNPLWLAFSAQDTRSNGQMLLGRVMNLSASLSPLLGEEHHTSIAIQQQFIEYSYVPFSKYRQYVLLVGEVEDAFNIERHLKQLRGEMAKGESCRNNGLIRDRMLCTRSTCLHNGNEMSVADLQAKYLSLGTAVWNPESTYPVIQFEEEDGFTVMVDGCQVIGMDNLVDAVAVLMSTYWVFNIQYPKSIKHTLSFFSTHILHLDVEVTSKDTTSHKVLNTEELCSVCWGHCKHKYLNNPLVDHLDSVVPTDLCDALYYLFCIFNKLTEPGTYPPIMDYEETELFLRKLLACLDMPWISTPDDSLFNEDFDKQEDFEPSPPLQVNFQQLLSIIADMVGVEMANSHLFYKAVRRLCLMEYQEVVKAGWVMVRKAGSDSWKKRWSVLQSSKLTCYDTVLCQTVKEEINLHSNMHVESLPTISSHKHRFRVVEKEGFTIICEHEFSCSDSNSSHSWISLANVAIKIHRAGMSAKTGEICERRLERFNRRESVREVYKKKQDVLETHQRLQEAKKRRSTIEERLQQRALQREEQMVFMTKMDKIYDRLESIQLQRRLHNKEEREKRLMKLFTSHEESIKLGRIIEDSWLHEKDDSKSLQELSAEEAQLESELEILQETPILVSSLGPDDCSNVVDNNPSITLRLPSQSVKHNHESSNSFSENTSMTSSDATMLTLPDVALHT